MRNKKSDFPSVFGGKRDPRLQSLERSPLLKTDRKFRQLHLSHEVVESDTTLLLYTLSSVVITHFLLLSSNTSSAHLAFFIPVSSQILMLNTSQTVSVLYMSGSWKEGGKTQKRAN